jgi:tRNA A58 N-methylase Trm61
MFTPSHLLHLLKTLATQPAYFYHRLVVVYHQLRKPKAPWLTSDAISILERLLTPDFIGFEWGSGKSTLWLAGRLKTLVSVEHDPEWYEIVRSDLTARNYTNLDLRLSSGDSYAAQIQSFPDDAFDFILIDGETRSRCIAAAASKIKAGGYIFIDNADTGYDVTPLAGFTYRPTDNGIWRTDIYIRPLEPATRP